MVVICCVCHKAKTGEDHWGHREIARHETLSHGYCPQCAQRVMDEIQRCRKPVSAAV